MYTIYELLDELMIKELSIIIPAYNEEHYLPKLLQSIYEQNFSGKLQVIVVDGKSEDNTVTVANSFKTSLPELVVLSTAKRGTSTQRNRGGKHAKYATLLFLDADVILPPNHLNAIAKTVSLKKEYIGHAIHIPSIPNFFDYLYYFYSNSSTSVFRFIEPIIPGSYILTSKKLFTAVGGFNENVILGEDSDFAKRAVKYGASYKLFYREFTYISTRRLRQMGRLKLLWFWAKYGLSFVRHGFLLDQKKFNYPFGRFGKEYA